MEKANLNPLTIRYQNFMMIPDIDIKVLKSDFIKKS